MGWRWVHETPAIWDSSKIELFGRLAAGIFALPAREEGESLPDDWWHVEDEGGAILGYGWADYNWAEAEVLVCVHPDHRAQGVGAWIFERLAEEAGRGGYRYLTNMVSPDHPERAEVTRWLRTIGFAPTSEGKLTRKI